jgi:hypothetical protein
VSHWSYPHEDFEDEIFTDNSTNWIEVLQRKEKLDLVRFMALSGNEQLDFLEKTVGAVSMAQAQQEGIEQTMDILEAQRFLEEVERMMQVQREIFIVPEVTSILINPDTLGGEEEKETPENTSTNNYTSQQTSR